MKTINQLINVFVILTEVGAIFRCIKLAFDSIGDPDSAPANWKKIKNVIIFMVLAALITSLKEIIMNYYGYSVI